jgi:hypothetical protein
MVAPDCYLATDPAVNDGLNQWFITGPEIFLTPDYLSDVYWQWNSTTGTWSSSGSVSPISYVSGIYAPSGNNVFYYFASGSGGSGPVNLSRFMVDDSYPSGGFLAPASGGEYIGGIYMLQASGSDDIAGIESYTFYINGKQIVELPYPADIYYWDTREELEGLKYLGLEVADKAGNAIGVESYVYLTNTPPVITYNEFNTPIFQTTLNITGIAAHPFAPVDRVEYWTFTSGGSAPDWHTAVITSGAGTDYVLWQIPLSGLNNNDIYTVKIRAWDVAGNVQNADNYETVSFLVRYI